MRTLVVILALALAGCAVLKNTREQDLVWEAYHACQAEHRIPLNIQIERVEPNGTYWWRAYSSAYGYGDMNACIQEKVAAAVRAGH
jgi:hypothetical protein